MRPLEEVVNDPRWSQWYTAGRLFVVRRAELIRLWEHGGELTAERNPDLAGSSGSLDMKATAAALGAQAAAFRSLEKAGMIEVDRLNARRTAAIRLTPEWRQHLDELMAEPEPEPEVPLPPPVVDVIQTADPIPAVSDDDAARIAAALLDRVVDLLTTEPDPVVSVDPHELDLLRERLGQQTAEAQRLRKQRDEARDRCEALTQQVTQWQSRARSEQDVAAQLRKAMERPVLTDRTRQDLDRLMREVPNTNTTRQEDER